MDKKLIIAAAVVAVVVIAVAAVFVLSDDDDPMADVEVTGDLVLYGNANNDNFLDSRDVDYINSIIDGKTEWDKKAFPYADANLDGKIDKEDVKLVNKILNKEPCVVHYKNWDLKVMDIHYPVTGDIAVNYEVGLNAAIIGGWYGQVTAMEETPAKIASLDQKLYPNSKNLKALRGEGNAYEYDLCLSAEVSLLTGEPYCFDDVLLKQLREHNKRIDAGGKGTYIDPLLLPYSREINGLTWVNTIYLLGVLTDHQKENKAYVDYISNLNNTIDDKLQNSPNVKPKTYLSIYVGTAGFSPTKTEFNADVYLEGAENYGDVTNLQMLPLVSAMKNPPDTYITLSIDEIIAMNPDVISIVHTNNELNEQQLREKFALFASYFSATKAYADQQIYWCGFDVIGGTAGPSALLYLASMIWPGEFDRDEGLAQMQDYYDKFTYADFKLEQTKYVPLGMVDL